MQDDSASFWGDIKHYEERLGNDPDSLLFARLAEIYLKVGLVDDALHIARQGVERHPAYVAGQRALALACDAKGLKDECCAALEKVTLALPEDGEAQKMLGRILSGQGHRDAAITAFRTALEFNPHDTECRVELESLERCAPSSPMGGEPEGAEAWRTDLPTADTLDAEFGAFEDDTEEQEEIIEDLEILDVDEADLLEMEEVEEDAGAEPFAPGVPDYDPLSTTTLAELYVQQGFTEKALEVYRAILAHDPDNAGVRGRITALEVGPTPEPAAASVALADEAAPGDRGGADLPSAAPAPSGGRGDEAVEILGGWLDNIRRLKGCH